MNKGHRNFERLSHRSNAVLNNSEDFRDWTLCLAQWRSLMASLHRTLIIPTRRLADGRKMAITLVMRQLSE